jgi:hypothetical protein
MKIIKNIPTDILMRASLTIKLIMAKNFDEFNQGERADQYSQGFRDELFVIGKKDGESKKNFSPVRHLLHEHQEAFETCYQEGFDYGKELLEISSCFYCNDPDVDQCRFHCL